MSGRQLRLKVSGMSCEGCRRAVFSAVMSVPGARGAEVRLETGEVFVTGDDGLNSAAVLAAIENAGFDVAPDCGA